MRVFIFVWGLIALCDAQQRCDCNVEHPQQMFCDADYAFVGTVLPRDDPTDLSIYKIGISDNQIYKGRSDFFTEGKTIVSVYTPYGTGLCGRTNLEIGKEYIITGDYLEKKLVMTLCNWVQAWEDVTDQQRSFLKDGGYLDHCHDCWIQGVKSEIEMKNVITGKKIPPWTQNGCYFNPVASDIYGGVDCETAYSNCYPNKDKLSECLWEVETSEYKNCSQTREEKWKKVNQPKAQAALTQFTTFKECKKLTNRRRKKQCVKSVKNYIKSRKEDLEPRAMLEELLDLRDLWLEDEDDADDDLLFN